MYTVNHNKDKGTWLVFDETPGSGTLATFTSEQEAYDFVASLEAEEGREDFLNEEAKLRGQTRIPGEDASFTIGF